MELDKYTDGTAERPGAIKARAGVFSGDLNSSFKLFSTVSNCFLTRVVRKQERRRIHVKTSGASTRPHKWKNKTRHTEEEVQEIELYISAVMRLMMDEVEVEVEMEMEVTHTAPSLTCDVNLNANGYNFTLPLDISLR